ncbi:MAG: hypothetical protein HWN67_05900 [Candidatus Helarchaeota archaeon]|nr:hypothetical protein [Candidatus Helarchaeota archaeon]
MAYNVGKKMLNMFLNEFLRKQGNSIGAVEKYFNKVQNTEKNNLERKISDAESKINSNIKDIERIKKDLKTSKNKKKDKEKKLNEKQALINDLKNKIKDYSKTITKLPGNAKNQVNEVRSILKEFYKLSTAFSKISTGKTELDKIMKTGDDYFNYVIRLNNKMSFSEFIRDSKLEFKISRPKKDVKITGYNQYMAHFLETILYYILETVEEEKLYKIKEGLAEKALSYAKGIMKFAKASKSTDVDYFTSLEKLCESEYISALAHQEFSNFNLDIATSYFLSARNLLKELNNLGKNFETLISEKISTLEAWASDAYHLIYLLNSYSRWAEVANSENPEIKEIAQITKDKVEDFITSQYGFPEENRIKEIIKKIKWIAPSTPPKVEKIGPIH